MAVQFGTNTLSILVQVAMLLLLAKFCTAVYGLFKKRWYLQELTKTIDDAGQETTFFWGNLKSVSSLRISLGV